MDVTYILARFWGLFLIITSFVFLLKGKKFIEELFESLKDRNFALLSGFIALIVGLVNITLHNVWVLDWPVLITIFGWLSLFKGVARLYYPQLSEKTAKYFIEKNFLLKVLLILAMILGVWLLWMSK